MRACCFLMLPALAGGSVVGPTDRRMGMSLYGWQGFSWSSGGLGDCQELKANLVHQGANSYKYG